MAAKPSYDSAADDRGKEDDGALIDPLALTPAGLDFVGLDTAVKVGEILYEEFREARYAPPALLKRMVLAGWFGKKSGRGFYDWNVTPPVPVAL